MHLVVKIQPVFRRDIWNVFLLCGHIRSRMPSLGPVRQISSLSSRSETSRCLSIMEVLGCASLWGWMQKWQRRVQLSLKSFRVLLCVLAHCSFNRLAHIFVYPPLNPLPCSKAYRAAQSTSNQHVAHLHLLSHKPVCPAAGRPGISLSAHGCICMYTSLWFCYVQSAYLNFISSIYLEIKLLNAMNTWVLHVEARCMSALL